MAVEMDRRATDAAPPTARSNVAPVLRTIVIDATTFATLAITVQGTYTDICAAMW